MRRKNSVPTYRLHKPTGQAVVTLPDGSGGRRDVYLGKYDDAPGSPSRLEYTRILAEWEASGRNVPQPATGPGLSINELIAAFWSHAETYYANKASRNIFRLSFRPLKRLYGHTPAKDFGPLALKAVRDAVTTGCWLTQEERDRLRHRCPQVLSRGVVNQRVGRIRHLFRWAVEEERLPAQVYHALTAVKDFAKGHSPARETQPIKPAPEAHIHAIVPHLRPELGDMLLVQLYSGMRPGELVAMRSADIDTSGPVWLYRPPSHKTAHHGYERPISLGPKSQQILLRYLNTADPDAFLFSPAQVVAGFRGQQRKERKSKVQPSQINRRKHAPRRKPGACYPVNSYANAIKRACDRAGVPRFHPNQVRHTTGTLIRKAFNLDGARAVLGHHSPVITEVYAELDMTKAAEIAAKLG